MRATTQWLKRTYMRHINQVAAKRECKKETKSVRARASEHVRKRERAREKEKERANKRERERACMKTPIAKWV